MGILTGAEILERIEKEQIIIRPFDMKRLQPNSYDVTLSNKMLVYVDEFLDLRKPNQTRELIIEESGTILYPNKVYIGSTNEYTETHGLVPIMHGKSSLGRLGIVPHVCAGLGDVGFKGVWTLEIHVIHPVKIYPNIPIAQLIYMETYGHQWNYTGKYQGDTGAVPSKFYENFTVDDKK